MEIIVKHGVLPTGFGLAIIGDAIYALSPCCGAKMTYRSCCDYCAESYATWGEVRAAYPGFSLSIALLTGKSSAGYSQDVLQDWFRKMSGCPGLTLEVS